MSPAAIEVTSGSEDETRALGATLADWLEPGDVVLLHGDLGAGKTTFAKGIAGALGIVDVVSSPSFALVNEYAVPTGGAIVKLFHLDLYRLVETDLDGIGYDDLLATTNAVTIIEWPERAGGHLPDRYLLLDIAAAGERRRQIRLSVVPNDERWQRRLRELPGALSARRDPAAPHGQ